MNIPDKMNCWGDFPAMVGYAACYEALAEECMELAHCALKLARVLRGDNPVKEGGRNYLDKFWTKNTPTLFLVLSPWN